ncbi:hypothetical protein Tco_0503102 [Tanacetum coccineum]
MAGDGVAGIKRRCRDLSSNDVRNLATAIGRGRLKEDLESSMRRRQGGGIYGEVGGEGFVASIACWRFMSSRFDRKERMAGPKENRVKVAEKEETGKFCGSPDGGPVNLRRSHIY